VIDYFIVNNAFISERIVEKYKLLEKKKPVKIKNMNVFKKKSYTVIEADLVHEADFVRHSQDKINKVLTSIIEENERKKEEEKETN
jgi:hypothetical protein